jgi:hypothetical protein
MDRRVLLKRGIMEFWKGVKKGEKFSHPIFHSSIIPSFQFLKRREI